MKPIFMHQKTACQTRFIKNVEKGIKSQLFVIEDLNLFDFSRS